MATLNDSTILGDGLVNSSDLTPELLPIKTSGQGWPK